MTRLSHSPDTRVEPSPTMRSSGPAHGSNVLNDEQP